MANHGGTGAKFVSVNLNKSYGPVSNRSNNNNNSTYGQAAAGRGRGGGGMVVLSRPRSSSQKPGAKLSVPPPLNLPSLRKEHERFDLSGPGGGSAGGAGTSGATRPTSSGVGWSKAATGALQDLSNDSGSVDGLIKGGSAFITPSLPTQLDKAAVLRGEDFPSLKAALPSGTAGPGQKNKDAPHHQRQRPSSSDESANEKKDRPSSSPEVHLTHHRTYGNGSVEKVGESYGLGNLPMTGQARKSDELFPGPLPLVQLNPRSDWADDERDTGKGFVDRSKDYGYANNEAYWDRDFDMPRNRVLPQKPADNQFQRWGKREDGSVRTFSNEASKVDSFAKTPGREGNSWRSTPLPKDGYDIVGSRTMDLNRGIARDDKYVPPRVDYSRGNATVNQDYNSGRRDGFGQGNQQYNAGESFNSRVNDRYTRDLYGTEQSNRYNKGYGLQNSSIPRSSFSPSGRGFSVNDSAVSAFSNTERTKPVDAFISPSSFDEQDPFSSGLVGVIKRKKDVAKQDDFHDPVRESFEAELERVQKMQEQERQRVADEQKRALERAQREEEERHRLVREEEEQRRRVEEAAREAAWRAEQEHLEAIRKAEELRMAREEEKKNMMMEEERRKQAARLKLLELEARMAKRKAETGQDSSSIGTSDDRKTTAVVDKDVSRVMDFESWEDSERMVEKIMTSGSSDSSGLNRSLVPGHRSQSSRDVGSGFVDRVKPADPWRSDILDRDSSVGGGAIPRRDFHGVLGYMPSRDNYRSGNQDNRSENDPYSRNIETEFHGNNSGDGGWGQGHSRSNAHYPYMERLSTDGDEPYSYGRSRYSMRQPRVLPPPSMVPVQRTVFREENERLTPSAFTPYDGAPLERVEASETTDVGQQNTLGQQMEKDSQSSLSVSSPPRSPAHLSPDDFNESGDSPTVSATEGIVAEKISREDIPVAGSAMLSDNDEDWTVEDNERLQEQEEYDEDEDGYQEEEEVHEGDDDLNREFDDLHIAEKGSLDMDNLVLGFDEGVEVGLPSDDFESSRNEEGAFADHQKPVDRKQEPDMAIPHSSINRLDSGPHTVPASDCLGTVDRSSVNIASQSSASQTVVPNAPVGSSPVNLPIKLQFGLFSGPPLIPSPVPAIQIGSIQMPLHIHPSISPSLTQGNQSQAPIFQFGKLRYTPPVSQGVVPITPQMPFVQPNFPVHYNLNQSSVSQMPIQPKQEGLANTIIKQNISSCSVGGGSNAVLKKVHETANPYENKFMPEAGGRNQQFSGVENHGQTNETVSKRIHNSEDSRGFRAQGQQSGFKSKRYAYVARNSNMRSAFPGPDASRSNSGGFQRRPRRTVVRTEFRVRDNMSNRQSFTGRDAGDFVRSGSKKELIANKSAEQMVEHEPSSSVQQANTDFGVENNPQSKEVNRKSDEDVDAPLQSGIVRVFKQPGIEAPSDEDDFIQVRSKRQMLNDRREQREKEIKAKSQVVKAPRRVGPIASNAVLSRSSSTKSALMGKEVAKSTRSDVVPKGRGLTNIEASKGFTSGISHPLAPIGTPPVTSDVQAEKKPQITKSLQTGASSATPYGEKDLGSSLVFETNNKIVDDVQTSDSWGSSHINQQVMALTQTQLDEAMRPGRFDTRVTSTCANSSVVNPIVAPSSIMTKDKSYSSSASPVNSLLAGEKIQFGAVTSPTVLAPSSRAVSHGIRAPGSSRSDLQTSHSFSTPDNDCTLLYEKKKHQSEPCVHLEDTEAEAEAEAAASAVVIAAISSDENVSVSDTKSFQGAHINGVAGGVANDPQLSSQSRPEESLSVSLPADLSVETPPMSLWPPLQSPQNSSGPMLSHIPGGPSSPFPFYEMGPMLGGPIFAFGPHDESGATQSQPQKSSVAGSTPHGAWQQFHTGPESFYGPPAGFPGPYMGPHGGIPGVQGPPHMVVYNHFPVGQFGQVGLSFMGTTYIPSGKQPDWKHNHATSNREADPNNMNMGSGSSNPPNLASPVQHLAPSPQLMPMPSPMALFDMSPFQSAPDMPAQGRWPHVTSSPLHSATLSMPPQQQETGVLNYSQASHVHTNSDQLLTANRFSEPRTSSPDSSQFPDELGLVNSSSSNIAGASTQTSTISNSAKPDSAQSGGSNNNTGHSMNSYKNRAPQRNLPSQHQYNQHSTGYNYQRNRTGYNQGRNNSMAPDKSFPAKMKQVYVAKQTTNAGSTVG